MNNRGFILVFTTAFILAFAMLGLGAMRWSGADYQVADQSKFSTQAFWLADAALERARMMLLASPSMMTYAGDTVNIPGMGDNAILGIIQTSTDPRVWVVHTKGFVPSGGLGFGSRFIEATIVQPVFPAPGMASLTATGTIGCDVKCAENMANGTTRDPALTFYDTFGVTWEQAIGMSTSRVLDGQKNLLNLLGISYLKILNSDLNGDTFSISKTGGGGLLLIDGSAITTTNAAVKLEGLSSFTGIVWIKNVDLKLGSLGSAFTGFFFVEGGSAGGDVDLNAKPVILAPGENNNIFSNAGLDKPMISSWQECNEGFDSPCTHI